MFENTDRQPPRYTAGLSGHRSPTVAHKPKADSQGSRQRMLTAANCPTRIDVVGRRHRAGIDPDVWARAQELWLKPNNLGSVTRWRLLKLATSSNSRPFSLSDLTTIHASELTIGGPNSSGRGGKQFRRLGRLHIHLPVGAQSRSVGATAVSNVLLISSMSYICGNISGSCIRDLLLTSGS